MSPSGIPGLERVLFTEEQIEARIREVAAAISRDYEGKSIKLIGVLKGSVFFLTALARHIEVPLKIDFLGISSFSNRSGAPGLVRIAKDLDDSIEGEDVLLVEDIVDTGFTLRYLLQTLAGRAPNPLSVYAPPVFFRPIASGLAEPRLHQRNLRGADKIHLDQRLVALQQILAHGLRAARQIEAFELAADAGVVQVSG